MQRAEGRYTGDQQRRKSSAEPAEGVEHTRCRAAAAGGDYVIEAGKDIGVVETFEEPKASHAKEQDWNADRPSSQEEKRYAAEQTDGLDQQAPVRPFEPQSVGKHATEKNAKHGGDLQIGRSV
jgi:hypothetical protein